VHGLSTNHAAEGEEGSRNDRDFHIVFSRIADDNSRILFIFSSECRVDDRFFGIIRERECDSGKPVLFSLDIYIFIEPSGGLVDARKETGNKFIEENLFIPNEERRKKKKREEYKLGAKMNNEGSKTKVGELLF